MENPSLPERARRNPRGFGWAHILLAALVLLSCAGCGAAVWRYLAG